MTFVLTRYTHIPGMHQEALYCSGNPLGVCVLTPAIDSTVFCHANHQPINYRVYNAPDTCHFRESASGIYRI